MRLVDPNVTAVDARDGRALTRGGRRGFPPGVGVLGELRTFAARFHRLGFCLVPGMLARLPSEPRAGAAQRMLTPLLSAIAGTELTPTYTFRSTTPHPPD